MRSVAKHSYIKGARGKARAKAHINYIQYRRGDDREPGKPREFYSADRDGITGRQVKQDIDDQERSKVVVHKLILSPGLRDVDIAAYTRQVMQEVGREKGLDLDWRAVTHANTEHDHAHVVIFGKDKNGREVLFRREDYQRMREAGDRYLERNHFYERFLERDSDRVLEKEYQRDRGDGLFEQLIADLQRAEADGPERERSVHEEGKREPRVWDKDKAVERLPAGEKIESGGHIYTKFTPLSDLQELDERLNSGQAAWLEKEDYGQLRSWIGTKERAGDDFYEREAKQDWDDKERRRRGSGEDEREFDEMDKYFRKAFKELESSSSFGKGHEQRLRESQGRLAADHGHYAGSMQIQELKDLMEQFPERKEELQNQIDELRALDAEQRESEGKWLDFDALLGENWKGPSKDKEQPKQVMTGERQLENEQLLIEHDNQAGDPTGKEDRDDKDRDEDAFARGEF